MYVRFSEIPSMTLQDIKDTLSTLIDLAPSPYFFIVCICPVDMNVHAKFGEIPSKNFPDIKETKRHGRTNGRTT